MELPKHSTDSRLVILSQKKNITLLAIIYKTILSNPSTLNIRIQKLLLPASLST